MSNFNRQGFKKKSEHALRREKVAIASFDALLEEQGTPSAKTTFPLLTPSNHLTHNCFTTFARHVRSHPGWFASRRKATPEEKAQYRETRVRKGNAYWIDVKYSPAEATKIATANATTQAATFQQQSSNSPEILAGRADVTPKRSVVEREMLSSPPNKKVKVLEDISNESPEDRRVTP